MIGGLSLGLGIGLELELELNTVMPLKKEEEEEEIRGLTSYKFGKPKQQRVPFACHFFNIACFFIIRSFIV